MISRYLLGLIYLAAGVIGLLNIFPPPTDMPAALLEFNKGLMAAKYFFPMLKTTEAVCGLLLIIGIAPALMLIILFPITLNIIMVHSFLTPGIGNLIVPLVILFLHIFATSNYWSVYEPLLRKNK